MLLTFLADRLSLLEAHFTVVSCSFCFCEEGSWLGFSATLSRGVCVLESAGLPSIQGTPHESKRVRSSGTDFDGPFGQGMAHQSQSVRNFASAFE